MKHVWMTEFESSESDKEDELQVPSHYKRYTVQDRSILLQTPERTKPQAGVSYDGPEDTKRVDLAEPGEDLLPVYIATDLTSEEEEYLIATLHEYRDVFAWPYKHLKGVDPSICQHTIPLREDAKPSRQCPYIYNETFAKKIKEEIDKLKDVEFIYEIEHIECVSPIVVVPKKNGKLCVCV